MKAYNVHSSQGTDSLPASMQGCWPVDSAIGREGEALKVSNDTASLSPTVCIYITCPWASNKLVVLIKSRVARPLLQVTRLRSGVKCQETRLEDRHALLLR